MFNSGIGIIQKEIKRFEKVKTRLLDGIKKSEEQIDANEAKIQELHDKGKAIAMAVNKAKKVISGKVIIAGGRDFNDQALFYTTMRECPFEITEVVCGMARGADMMGHRWAKRNGSPVAEFPADWVRLGKRAGYARNRQMGEYADAIIAFPDGRGTSNMVQIMVDLEKPVMVIGDKSYNFINWSK
jgi:hypothetical protein